MPKRIRDKFNTVLVKFYKDITDVEVRSALAFMGVSGSRVSTLVRRWAVEVPYWLEDEFVEKFYDCELVQAVHNNFNKDEEAQTEGRSDEKPRQ
jgi:hypothetical protein